MTRHASAAKRTAFLTASGVAAITAVAALGLALPSPAQAHGYVGGPGAELQTRAAMAANASLVGNARWEPQSLEAPKGWPSAPNSPADGMIASAGGAFGGLLDRQTPNLWAKQDINPGVNKIVWNYTAPHSTAGWEYYITKKNWDPSAPLTRAQFDSKPIAVIKHDGSAANTVPTHFVDVPADHTGYQVILAIWDIGDTPAAFYNVIDVNISGTAPAPDTQAPSAPGNLQVSSRTVDSISLSWKAATDNTGVDGYRVRRDGQVVGTTTNTTYVDDGLAPGSQHTYTVTAIDADKNESAPSNSVTGQTEAPPSGGDTTPPTAPRGLYASAKTSTTVDLAWTAASDNVGVDHYDIMRATGGGSSAKVGRVGGSAATEFHDSGLAPGTRYTYSVVAVDAAGNSAPSDAKLDVTTDSAPGGGGGGGSHATWDPRAAYKIGDKVSYQGENYQCVQGYQGYGDPGWIKALSLWKPIGAAAGASSDPGSSSSSSSSSSTTTGKAGSPQKVAVTGTVKVTGRPRVGGTLTAVPGKAPGARVTYQWLSNGKAISKATGKSLRLTKAQKGKKVQVRVTYAKSGSTRVTQLSAKLTTT